MDVQSDITAHWSCQRGPAWMAHYLDLAGPVCKMVGVAPAGCGTDGSPFVFEPSPRYDAVIAEIDAANDGDPRSTETPRGGHAYESVYSQRMTERLGLMYPEASELLRIAAHGQHIRRFDIPRAKYPEGRSGYNDWRRACREHHAVLLGAIMRRHGYDESDVDHVGRLVRKEQLKKDRESQALENVVGVVFLDHYFDEFEDKHRDYDDDKFVDIIGKTLKKMSPRGHEAALGLDLPERTRRLVLAAIEKEKAAIAALARVAID